MFVAKREVAKAASTVLHSTLLGVRGETQTNMKVLHLIMFLKIIASYFLLLHSLN